MMGFPSMYKAVFEFLCIAVTKTNRAEVALTMLRENKNGFDIVISDVHMPDMDGFKLLEHVGLEMDLPVISMYLFSYVFSSGLIPLSLDSNCKLLSSYPKDGFKIGIQLSCVVFLLDSDVS